MKSTFTLPSNSFADRRRILTLLFVLALAIRFVNLLCLNQYEFFEFKIGDAARYDAWANEIAAGNWIGDKVFYQAPLYPYFLAGLYSTVGDNVFLIKLIQAVLASLAVTLLAATAWNFFGRRAAIVTGAIAACYVPSLFLESLIQKSILDLVFISTICWLLSRLYLQNLRRLWLGLGLSIGALCLTRENAIALIPLFALATVFYWPRSQESAPAATKAWQRMLRQTRTAMPLYVLGLLIVLGPVVARNYWIGGELHLTTSQVGPNFYIGNNADADGFYHPLVVGRGDAQFEQQDAIAIAEQESGRALTAAEVSAFYLDKSKTFIQENPASWLSLVTRKTLLSVNAREIVDTEDQSVYEQHSPLLWLLSPFFQFGTLLPIAVIGAWRTRRQWRKLWPLYLMAILIQLTLIAFFVFGRYRFPIVPILILFAAPALADAWSGIERLGKQAAGKRPLGQLAIPCLVGVVLLLICHLPLVPRQSQRSVTYNNFAIQSLIRGNWRQAEVYVDRSLANNVDFALAHNSRGVLCRERGEIGDAKYHFKVAVELEPEYDNAKRNLAALQPNVRKENADR